MFVNTDVEPPVPMNIEADGSPALCCGGEADIECPDHRTTVDVDESVAEDIFFQEHFIVAAFEGANLCPRDTHPKPSLTHASDTADWNEDALAARVDHQTGEQRVVVVPKPDNGVFEPA